MSDRVFSLVLVQPSHYDDDGYVIQWLRSPMPANTLATMNGLALDCARRRVLGDDVLLRVRLVNETNTRVRAEHLARWIRRGGHGMVGMVGVQTNQFPRALDLARRFLSCQVPVCMGGFHVSGSLAGGGELSPELREAVDMGVSLFAGEAEGRLEGVLADAFQDRLQPVYGLPDELPDLAQAAAPEMPLEHVRRTGGRQASFDAGRGCPFSCSFCTIFSVQGHASRCRTPAQVEAIITRSLRQGIRRFLITDDNFTRNRRWEEIFDRLSALQRRDRFKLALQVDALSHAVPGFVTKARAAGVRRVFIGLENINPENLAAANKRQNRLEDYREMLLAWKRAGVVTVAGYIIGFPGDTVESIRRDVEIIQRELPVDLVQFLILTPLPGSQEHRNRVAAGEELEADLNRYDLVHVTAPHPLMNAEQLRQAYHAAWQTYYSADHVVTLLRRARACGINIGKIAGAATWFAGSVTVEGLDPLECGLLRRKVRADRRPGLPIPGPLGFYPRYLAELASKTWRAGKLYVRNHLARKAILDDPRSKEYSDGAIAPPANSSED